MAGLSYVLIADINRERESSKQADYDWRQNGRAGRSAEFHGSSKQRSSEPDCGDDLKNLSAFKAGSRIASFEPANWLIERLLFKNINRADNKQRARSWRKPKVQARRRSSSLDSTRFEFWPNNNKLGVEAEAEAAF